MYLIQASCPQAAPHAVLTAIWFFGFWFLDTILSPCGGHPFTGKDLGSCHSTLCFHRDSKVSIDSSERLRSKPIINKLGIT